MIKRIKKFIPKSEFKKYMMLYSNHILVIVLAVGAVSQTINFRVYLQCKRDVYASYLVKNILMTMLDIMKPVPERVHIKNIHLLRIIA